MLPIIETRYRHTKKKACSDFFPLLHTCSDYSTSRNMEIEDRLGTEGLYSHCMLAPFCISIWCPVVSVVYTAIYTKSDLWDVYMSSLVITSSSESLYYLGLPRILNFLFSIQVDIAIILSWEWFPQPGYTQCVWNPVLFACSGWLKYRRLVLARHRIIRAAMPRMISS